MNIELDDIQGIILKGYGKLDDGCFLMLQINDPVSAKKWLGEIVPSITNSIKVKEKEHCLNIAFTFQGLLTLGMNKDEAQVFA